MLKYDTLEQAQLRLNGSTITYKEQAVYVREATVLGDGTVGLSLDTYPLRTASGNKSKQSKRFEIRADDPDLNFRIFRLGYCNDADWKGASYLTRNGRRQQTQGLSRATVNGLASDNTMFGQGFEDMLFDKYPSPVSAQAMLADGWSLVGISRDFAIGPDPDFKSIIKLYYRGVAVGVSIGDSVFKLSEEYHFLKEVVQEQDIPFTLIGGRNVS